MPYALLLLPALLALAYLAVRARRRAPQPAPPRPRPRVVAEAVPAPPTISGEIAEQDPFDALEALLDELERATLDERDALELDALAAELEAAAERLERVG